MPKIELDVAYETLGQPLSPKYLWAPIIDADEAAAMSIGKLIAGLPITAHVVDSRGPAGGWPIVIFEGPEEALIEMIGRYTLDDPMGRDFIISQIEYP